MADDTAVATVVMLLAPSATLFDTEAFAPAPSAVADVLDALLPVPTATAFAPEAIELEPTAVAPTLDALAASPKAEA